MKLNALFLCVVFGALAAAVGLALRGTGHQIAVFAQALRSIEDEFVDLARYSGAAPVFAQVVFIDIDAAYHRRHWEETSPRAPPLTVADRTLIAETLSQLRGTGAELVMLDIDVSPLADAAAETALRAALLQWASDERAPRLLLVRSEACFAPPRGRPESVPASTVTPYDDIVDPTGVGSISWVCAGTEAQIDGRLRRMLPFGCIEQPSGRGALASAGTLARLRGEALAQYLRQAADRCNGRAGAADDGLPTVFDWPDWRSSSARYVRVPIGDLAAFSATSDLSNNVVVVGQTHARAGDRRSTSIGPDVPGAVFVAAHIDTLTRFRGGVALGELGAIVLALGLGAFAGWTYAGLRWVRQKIIAALSGATAATKVLRFTSFIVLSPPLLAAGVTLVITGGLALSMAPILDLQSWDAVWHAIAGAGVVLALLDFALAYATLDD